MNLNLELADCTTNPVTPWARISVSSLKLIHIRCFIMVWQSSRQYLLLKSFLKYLILIPDFSSPHLYFVLAVNFHHASIWNLKEKMTKMSLGYYSDILTYKINLALNFCFKAFSCCNAQLLRHLFQRICLCFILRSTTSTDVSLFHVYTLYSSAICTGFSLYWFIISLWPSGENHCSSPSTFPQLYITYKSCHQHSASFPYQKLGSNFSIYHHLHFQIRSPLNLLFIHLCPY